MKYQIGNLVIPSVLVKTHYNSKGTTNLSSIFIKMAKAKRVKLSLVHETLPNEIFVKILKMLGYKSIKNALATCKRWKQIINDFKIVEAAYCKLIF